MLSVLAVLVELASLGTAYEDLYVCFVQQICRQMNFVKSLYLRCFSRKLGLIQGEPHTLQPVFQIVKTSTFHNLGHLLR